MTNPTIPPQQPEPERVCGNCEHFKLFSWSEAFGDCSVSDHLPPCLSVLRMGATEVGVANTCVLFRARKES